MLNSELRITEKRRSACSLGPRLVRAGRKMEMHIQSQLDQSESNRRGIAEIEAGHFIPHEAMKAWLLSLGLDRESPPPLCVCGQLHEEPVKDE
ncbi:MAG: hypothetical protein WAO35_16745 [Terriglobia bacterium]